jgi:hypothetical protein
LHDLCRRTYQVFGFHRIPYSYGVLISARLPVLSIHLLLQLSAFASHKSGTNRNAAEVKITVLVPFYLTGYFLHFAIQFF